MSNENSNYNLLVNGIYHDSHPIHAQWTRFLHWILPLETQLELRNSGAIRLYIDGSTLTAIGILAVIFPKLTWRYLNISKMLRVYCYGSHKSQVFHWIPTNSDLMCKKTFIFIHEGAWGSGKPWMYRLLASRFLVKGFNVAFIGYRTYPDGNIDDQIDDVENGMDFLRTNFINENYSTIILGGHSSGAHITSMYLLRRCEKPNFYSDHPKINLFIGFSGVYNVKKHYIYESWR